MTETTCPFESRVSEAAGARNWTPDLQNHLAECPDCADLALVNVDS